MTIIQTSLEYSPAESVLEPIYQTGGLAQKRGVHVRSSESLKRRTGHHLNLAVQDYFGSGIPGYFFPPR